MNKQATETHQLRGKTLRQGCPRSSHAEHQPAVKRDPVALIERSSIGRVPALLPIRYGRMLQSPFTFLRGTAMLQAFDLASTPSTGLTVQCCGDAHLMNFGAFATPERNLIFDINDFDETLPAPWEWDLKRLAVSAAVAARHLGLGDGQAMDVAINCAASYQQHMQDYAAMSLIEVWYDKLTFDRLHAEFDDPDLRKRLGKAQQRASGRTHESLLDKLTTLEGGELRLRDAPPSLFHIHSPSSMLPNHDRWLETEDWQALLADMFKGYGATLQDDRRRLLGHYRVLDAAFKMVGVGSIGTRCLVVLMMDDHGQPLFMQIKEARPSVLAPYVDHPRIRHEGQRVIQGQRLMQAASDAFLGWCSGPFGRHFYVRQLRDMKASAQIESYGADMLNAYLRGCAWALARAHAKSSALAPDIAAYLGSSITFAQAIGQYAMRYADQVEADYEAFRKAVAHGRLPVDTLDDPLHEVQP